MPSAGRSPCPAGKYSYGLTDTYTSRLFGLAGFTWSLTLSLNHSRVLISNPREERLGCTLARENQSPGWRHWARDWGQCRHPEGGCDHHRGHHVGGDQVSGTNTEPDSNLETSLQYYDRKQVLISATRAPPASGGQKVSLKGVWG